MKNKLTTLLGCACLLTLSASAATFTFDTPSGATTSGGPVDAEAIFSISGTTLSITLTDKEANPTDVAQLLSDLQFHVTIGSATGATLTGSSGQEVSVDGNGNPTLGSTVSTGWALETVNNNTDLHLHVLGTPTGPSHLIIGPPDGTGVYSDANGSIAHNQPHNPFLNGSASFTLNIPGMTTDSIVDSAIFSFGTTAGIDVTGTPNVTPVPDGGTTVLLLGAAISGLGLIRRKLS